MAMKAYAKFKRASSVSHEWQGSGRGSVSAGPRGTRRSHSHHHPLVVSLAWLLGAACGIENVELRSSSIPELPQMEGITTEPDRAASVREVSTPPVSESEPSVALLPQEQAPSQEVPVVPEVEVSVGCSKVDVLFVIDNSPSMDDEQDALIQSFPGFVSLAQSALELTDVHIMVVDTDGETPFDQVTEEFGFSEACDNALGAGSVLGEGGAECAVPAGQRYMEGTQPNLSESFSCVANVGDDGSLLARPADAMLAALSSEHVAVSGCNAGFLRDDAVLVVVMITDEDDERSARSPADWRSALVAQKAGDEAAIVTLGLLRQSESEQCGDTRSDPTPRLRELLTSFPRSTVGDVCAPDYNSFFSSGVDLISAACSAFVAPAR
jgi:hypothetical protein